MIEIITAVLAAVSLPVSIAAVVISRRTLRDLQPPF